MGMPRGSAGGGKRGGVSFSRPQDPAFLRRMKEQVGYKNPVEDLKAKQMLDHSGLDDEQDEQDDEKPTVVVLKEGDLTSEEVDRITKKLDEEELEPADGRIIFKKPVKRKTDSVQENSTDEKEAKIKKKEDKKPKQNLLSFNDDDEEDT